MGSHIHNRVTSRQFCQVSSTVFFLFKGVCPQQNVLFNFLTVKEHLEFYSGLKEVPVEDTEALVNKHGSLGNLGLHRQYRCSWPTNDNWKLSTSGCRSFPNECLCLSSLLS